MVREKDETNNSAVEIKDGMQGEAVIIKEEKEGELPLDLNIAAEPTIKIENAEKHNDGSHFAELIKVELETSTKGSETYECVSPPVESEVSSMQEPETSAAGRVTSKQMGPLMKSEVSSLQDDLSPHICLKKSSNVTPRTGIPEKPTTLKNNLSVPRFESLEKCRQKKNHSVKSSGEKSYPCTICLRKFSTKRSLNVHLKLHSDKKPFACSYCPAKFKLKLCQERTHTGERPFACDKCPMKFTQRSGLKNHLKRLHSDKETSHRVQCLPTFRVLTQFKRHPKKHSNQKPVVTKTHSLVPQADLAQPVISLDVGKKKDELSRNVMKSNQRAGQVSSVVLPSENKNSPSPKAQNISRDGGLVSPVRSCHMQSVYVKLFRLKLSSTELLTVKNPPLPKNQKINQKSDGILPVKLSSLDENLSSPKIQKSVQVSSDISPLADGDPSATKICKIPQKSDNLPTTKYLSSTKILSSDRTLPFNPLLWNDELPSPKTQKYRQFSSRVSSPVADNLPPTKTCKVNRKFNKLSSPKTRRSGQVSSGISPLVDADSSSTKAHKVRKSNQISLVDKNLPSLKRQPPDSVNGNPPPAKVRKVNLKTDKTSPVAKFLLSTKTYDSVLAVKSLPLEDKLPSPKTQRSSQVSSGISSVVDSNPPPTKVLKVNQKPDQVLLVGKVLPSRKRQSSEPVLPIKSLSSDDKLSSPKTQRSSQVSSSISSLADGNPPPTKVLKINRKCDQVPLVGKVLPLRKLQSFDSVLPVKSLPSDDKLSSPRTRRSSQSDISSLIDGSPPPTKVLKVKREPDQVLLEDKVLPLTKTPLSDSILRVKSLLSNEKLQSPKPQRSSQVSSSISPLVDGESTPNKVCKVNQKSDVVLHVAKQLPSTKTSFNTVLPVKSFSSDSKKPMPNTQASCGIPPIVKSRALSPKIQKFNQKSDILCTDPILHVKSFPSDKKSPASKVQNAAEVSSGLSPVVNGNQPSPKSHKVNQTFNEKLTVDKYLPSTKTLSSNTVSPAKSFSSDLKQPVSKIQASCSVPPLAKTSLPSSKIQKVYEKSGALCTDSILRVKSFPPDKKLPTSQIQNAAQDSSGPSPVVNGNQPSTKIRNQTINLKQLEDQNLPSTKTLSSNTFLPVKSFSSDSKLPVSKIQEAVASCGTPPIVKISPLSPKIVRVIEKSGILCTDPVLHVNPFSSGKKLPPSKVLKGSSSEKLSTPKIQKASSSEKLPPSKIQSASSGEKLPTPEILKAILGEKFSTSKIQRASSGEKLPTPEILKASLVEKLSTSKIQTTSSGEKFPPSKIQSASSSKKLATSKIQRTSSGEKLPLSKIQKTGQVLSDISSLVDENQLSPQIFKSNRKSVKVSPVVDHLPPSTKTLLPGPDLGPESLSINEKLSSSKKREVGQIYSGVSPFADGNQPSAQVCKSKRKSLCVTEHLPSTKTVSSDPAKRQKSFILDEKLSTTKIRKSDQLSSGFSLLADGNKPSAHVRKSNRKSAHALRMVEHLPSTEVPRSDPDQGQKAFPSGEKLISSEIKKAHEAFPGISPLADGNQPSPRICKRHRKCIHALRVVEHLLPKKTPASDTDQGQKSFSSDGKLSSSKIKNAAQASSGILPLADGNQQLPQIHKSNRESVQVLRMVEHLSSTKMSVSNPDQGRKSFSRDEKHSPSKIKKASQVSSVITPLVDGSRPYIKVRKSNRKCTEVSHNRKSNNLTKKHSCDSDLLVKSFSLHKKLPTSKIQKSVRVSLGLSPVEDDKSSLPEIHEVNPKSGQVRRTQSSDPILPLKSEKTQTSKIQKAGQILFGKSLSIGATQSTPKILRSKQKSYQVLLDNEHLASTKTLPSDPALPAKSFPLDEKLPTSKMQKADQNSSSSPLFNGSKLSRECCVDKQTSNKIFLVDEHMSSMNCNIQNSAGVVSGMSSVVDGKPPSSVPVSVEKSFPWNTKLPTLNTQKSGINSLPPPLFLVRNLPFLQSQKVKRISYKAPAVSDTLLSKTEKFKVNYDIISPKKLSHMKSVRVKLFRLKLSPAELSAAESSFLKVSPVNKALSLQNQKISEKSDQILSVKSFPSEKKLPRSKIQKVAQNSGRVSLGISPLIYGNLQSLKIQEVSKESEKTSHGGENFPSLETCKFSQNYNTVSSSKSSLTKSVNLKSWFTTPPPLKSSLTESAPKKSVPGKSSPMQLSPAKSSPIKLLSKKSSSIKSFSSNSSSIKPAPVKSSLAKSLPKIQKAIQSGRVSPIVLVRVAVNPRPRKIWKVRKKLNQVSKKSDQIMPMDKLSSSLESLSFDSTLFVESSVDKGSSSFESPNDSQKSLGMSSTLYPADLKQSFRTKKVARKSGHVSPSAHVNDVKSPRYRMVTRRFGQFSFVISPAVNKKPHSFTNRKLARRSSRILPKVSKAINQKSRSLTNRKLAYGSSGVSRKVSRAVNIDLSSKNSFQQLADPVSPVTSPPLPKSFACSYCEAKFKRNIQLKMHLQTHTVEEAFSCELCGAVFYQISSILRHYKLHFSNNNTKFKQVSA